MNSFTILPAIDLLDGCVVRLAQGKRENLTQYELSPSDAALKWVQQGAKWLHIINLNGAFGEDSQVSYTALKNIIGSINGSASIQFGGGLRTLAAIDHALSIGVSRIVLGTAAVKNPDLVKNALRTFGPDRITLAVDAKEGLVRVAGWEENASISPIELVERYQREGLDLVIYTNILRDGMQSGVDVEGAKLLGKLTDVRVIASGGVGNLEDLRNIKNAGLAGVIVGKALLENQFSLSEALKC